MTGRFQKNIHPGVAAVLVLAVLVAVQGVWWRGLVTRPPSKPAGFAGGGALKIPPPQVNILGRSDVQVETYAGDQEPGDSDGPGHEARFDRPTGLAVDVQGNLYIADTGNHRIRKISPDGLTATLAGGDEGFTDGPADRARFQAPCGICVAPDGALYVADTGNGAVRRIQNGLVVTIARYTPNLAAQPPSGLHPLAQPSGIAYVAGDPPFLLVADAGDKRLHKLGLNGTLEAETNLAGPPTAVVGTPQTAAAIPQTGLLLIGNQSLHNLPVEGADMPNPELQPLLRHPVGLWPMGRDWLVTDSDYGALFMFHEGKAGVLAGHCSSAGPMRAFKDGDGAHANFSILSGVVTDGKKFIYVADTANNSIRRLTLPEAISR